MILSMRSIAFVAATACLSTTASATTLDLNLQTPVNNPADFSESDFDMFTNSDIATGPTWCGPPCPDNGTRYTLFTRTTETMTLTSSVGDAFASLGFDGAEAHLGVL